MQRRNSNAIIGWVLGTFAALLLFALTAHASPEQLREEFHQSYPLTANGRFELSNINGNVQIAAWDRNEVKVDAVKTARSKERLDECRIEVDAQPDSVRVATKYPERQWGRHSDEDNPATVDYTISVPRSARLDSIKLVNGSLKIDGVSGDVRASSVNGNVSASGLSGRVDVSSVNGAADATMLSLANDLNVHSVNGRVTVTIPSDAKADVHASTVNGHIGNDFGLNVDRGRYVGSSMNGRLGSGGPHIDLKTVNGSITLRHAADGKPISSVFDRNKGNREPL